MDECNKGGASPRGTQMATQSNTFLPLMLGMPPGAPPRPVLSPGPGTATGGWYPRRKPLAGKEPGSPGGCGEVAGLRDPPLLAD